MRRAALALALAACGTTGGGQPFDAGTYQVGVISFHIASGAAVTTPALMVVLSDQPDTCNALSLIPVQQNTKLSLKLVPAAGGTTQATVVPGSSPGPGEATGSLAQATGTVQGPRYDAASGSVAWTANSNGSVTITALDVGFAGVPDRIVLPAAVTVPPCAP